MAQTISQARIRAQIFRCFFTHEGDSLVDGIKRIGYFHPDSLSPKSVAPLHEGASSEERGKQQTRTNDKRGSSSNDTGAPITFATKENCC